MRWKKNNERKPIFNQDKFFFIFLWWSCLDLLEIALLFYKNSRIYFRWEMLTNILSICYIFLEKKIALFKKTGKKKQFCLEMNVLSIFCFPLTFSILWSELWHAKTVTCYQYSLKILWHFPGGLGAMKVLHFTVRTEDGVHKTKKWFIFYL